LAPGSPNRTPAPVSFESTVDQILMGRSWYPIFRSIWANQA
jgi:hypothetical protein